MIERNSGLRLWGVALAFFALATLVPAQSPHEPAATDEFGPNVRAYLRYLKDEEEVVDDRISRREIRRDYYLRNMNRIKALRQVALQIARTSGNDYLPELEAVAPDELGTIFEHPPALAELKPGEVLNNTFRFVAKVRTGQLFFVFVRLDPYEQAEWLEREKRAKATGGVAGNGEAAPTPEQKAIKSP
jgi:hypothetical protein